MPPTTIIDPTQIDLSHVVADAVAIEAINPHRHGMRMLDAIVLIDREQHLIVGYKDCRHDEFWVRGHMPGYPIFPGVLQCEAAAQMAGYYFTTHGFRLDNYLGLGGIDEARFRAPVRPGDRLVLVGKGLKVDRRKTVFDVQGYVGSTMAFNLQVTGMPIPGPAKAASPHVQLCANGAAV
jgi:3-hydroxyacyl-[acyl-carrier-protein] dehydratase